MTAIVFPGQGSQYAGMAKDFYDNFSNSKYIFDLIENTVSMDLKKIIFENPDNLLDITNYTQISIFASSLTIFEALKEITQNKINFKYMLGHSLGEYSALTASKKLSIEDAATLLKKRGELMQNAVGNKTATMAALIGLNSNTVEEIIESNRLNIQVANDNSPVQVVISGKIEDINKSKEIFQKYKLKKFVPLKVSSAFHSRYMESAQIELNKLIDKTNFNFTDTTIISNYSAQPSKINSEIIDFLKMQMSNKVRWKESIEKLEELGAHKIIEIGPGNVLSGLIKRISSNFDIFNVNKIEDLEIIDANT